jgi:hypothetical protein
MSPHPSSSSRWLTALLLAATLAGVSCARTYTITTTTAGTIYCKGRPKLSAGYYYYRDADGRERRINELRVREIAVQ